MKKVLILTLGGSYEPIVKSIKDINPNYTLFLCSDDSPTVKGSYTQLTDKVEKKNKDCTTSFLPNIPSQVNLKAGTWDITKIKYFDDLSACYQSSISAIKNVRERFLPEEIIVDYTGGTKSMSAGLAAAALDDGNCKIVLVSGMRSDLEKVRSKTEYVKPVAYYDTLANKNLIQAAPLLKRFDFSGAVNLLESSIRLPLSNEKEEELKKCLDICKGFDAWDRFDHDLAFQLLDPYRKYFVPYVIPLERIKKDVGGNSLSYMFVEDLLLNAERRAVQGRYEDAIGRIYRAIELTAQIRLRTEYQQDTGNIAIESLQTIEEEFRTKLERHRNSEDDKVQLGLILSYELLTELRDQVIHPWFDHNKNRIKNFLSYRNNSLFAHGYKAIDRDTYEREVPQIMEIIRQLINDLYIGEKKKRVEIPQFPDRLLGE